MPEAGDCSTCPLGLGTEVLRPGHQSDPVSILPAQGAFPTSLTPSQEQRLARTVLAQGRTQTRARASTCGLRACPPHLTWQYPILGLR